MGLDYSHRIYVKKENLTKTLKYVYDHCKKDSTDFKFEEEQCYKINGDKLERINLDSIINQDSFHYSMFYSCLIFEKDDKIIEYYLEDLVQRFDPEYSLKDYQVDNNSYWVGTIEIDIDNYSSKIENIIEISFRAVTSQMSHLLVESKSINIFFENLCREIQAEYACIWMEDEGYKLTWFEGEKCNYVVYNWDTVQEYGFIPIMKQMLQK